MAIFAALGLIAVGVFLAVFRRKPELVPLRLQPVGSWFVVACGVLIAAVGAILLVQEVDFADGATSDDRATAAVVALVGGLLGIVGGFWALKVAPVAYELRNPSFPSPFFSKVSEVLYTFAGVVFLVFAALFPLGGIYLLLR